MNSICKAIAVIVLSFPVLGFAQGVIRTFQTTVEFDAIFEGFVNVELACNSGIPLNQSFDLMAGGSVTFTVDEMMDGSTCFITQSVAENFTTSYLANDVPSSDACEFVGSEGGNFLSHNICLISNIAVNGSSFEIVNLNDGDSVDAADFTVVGKARGYSQGGEFLIHLNVCNMTSLMCDDVYLDCEGMVTTGNSTIQNQLVKKICPLKHENFTVVGKSYNHNPGDIVQIWFRLWSVETEVWREELITVHAK